MKEKLTQDWFDAIKKGNKEKINWFLNYKEILGLDVNIKYCYGYTALIYAVHQGSVEMVKLLLDANADVNIQTEWGDNAIMLVTGNSFCGKTKYFNMSKEHKEIYKLVLARKKQNNYNNCLPIIKQLKRKIKYINNEFKVTDEEKKEWFSAISSCDAKKVEIMIQKGIDINIQDENGDTALIKSSRNSRLTNSLTNIPTMLIKANADVNIQNNYGNTALMVCECYSARKNISLRSLILACPDVNIQNKDGKTALMFACSFGHAEKIKFLLEAGADVKIKDKDGRTAFDYANYQSKKDVRDLLYRYRRIEPIYQCSYYEIKQLEKTLNEKTLNEKTKLINEHKNNKNDKSLAVVYNIIFGSILIVLTSSLIAIFYSYLKFLNFL